MRKQPRREAEKMAGRVVAIKNTNAVFSFRINELRETWKSLYDVVIKGVMENFRNE